MNAFIMKLFSVIYVYFLSFILFFSALTECIVNQRPCVAYPVFTETYSTGDLDLVVDAMKKVFHSEPFLKAAASLQDNSKLCQYRDRNMRKETLDRYM